MKTQEEIISDLKVFESWLDRFNYIIELGRQLPTMPANLLTPANSISVCPGTLYFGSGYAYANTEITAGLAALVLMSQPCNIHFHHAAIDGSTLYNQLSLYRQMAIDEMIKRHAN